MADAGSMVYGPAQPGTTNATLYTVPGSTTAHLKTIHVMNTTGSAATINIAFNGTAATQANCFLYQFSVPANGTYNWNGTISLDAADTIQGLQGTSAALTVVISAVLET